MFDKLPNHIAMILDGNGRWAQRQGLRRESGHEAGARAVREVTTECARLGIKVLTLFAFSAENWKRPQLEVNYLMRLLNRYLIAEREQLMENNIRLISIGRIENLSARVLRTLRETEQLTANNQGMQLCLALSYGGKQEIVDAVKRIGRDMLAGHLRAAEINEQLISKYLYAPQLPDPDLLIRTAGEMRVSNFLLWQMSYTEFYVTSTCWPEFRKEDLHAALAAYQARTRKFGALANSQISSRPLFVHGK